MNLMNNDRKKYIIVFLITLGIFIVVFGLVSVLNQQKIRHIDELQRDITADLIATETQFDLLKTAPCGSLENSLLSEELHEFGQKLSFAQENQGSNNDDVLQLKKYYSLLQVKDYLLMQEFSNKCNLDIDSLLYFYSTECDDCRKQGYVLTEFKEQYPDVRIYSFDTDLDFPVINTFASLYEFDTYPTLIINDDVYQEYINLEQIQELFPELVQRKVTEENIEKGINYITSLNEYSEIEQENIIFHEVINDVYYYNVVTDDGLLLDDIVLSLNDDSFEIKK